MLKARFIVAVLSAMACFTVVTPLAHAGGGMGGGLGVSTCRLILNGAPNQPQTIALTDTLTVGPDQIKVGAAVLLCDLAAAGTTVDGPPTVNPIPVSNESFLTCYSVSGADQARIGATMKDTFTQVNPAVTQPVQIGAIQLLCVPSLISDIH